jgi:hypothetical protein
MSLEVQSSSANSGLPEQAISDAAIHEAALKQLDSILASESFRSSQRYSNLLRHIVSRSLAGDAADLKERIIGIDVFGRSPDYDTGADPTVRVAMSEVRKRICQYYSLPEHLREFRIDIPLGTYVAAFHAAPQSPESIPQTGPSLEIPTLQRPPRKNRRITLALVCAAVLCALAGALLWSVNWRLTVDPMWKPLVADSGPVLIGIGASIEPTGSPAVVGQGNHASVGSANLPEDTQLRVGLIDVHSANDLADFLRSQGKESRIRPTLGADLVDAQNNSIVLYGRYLNEWHAQLRSDLRFRMISGPEGQDRWIMNAAHPLDRSFAIHRNSPDAPIEKDYALITRVQSELNKHWTLGIAGLTGQGTRAANALMLDPRNLHQIEQQLPRGWQKKNVQIVMEIHVARNVLGASRILTYAVW